MTGWIIGLVSAIVDVAAGIAGSGMISHRWDRIRGVDPKLADAGDEATVILATHGAALPMKTTASTSLASPSAGGRRW
jgi:hypothetical protein